MHPGLGCVALPFAALCLVLSAPPLFSSSLNSCSQAARVFVPCELSFDWQSNELPPSTSPYKDEVLNVEFRSPLTPSSSPTTYRMEGFWDGGHSIRVRFTPTQPGPWTYKLVSSIPRFDNQESNFNVADNPAATGMVGVANLRHWWTTGKKPHLWLSASVPFLDLDQSALESWLDARKHDGFTHIRGTILAANTALSPLTSNFELNLPYFAALDNKLLAAVTRGFTLDLILAAQSITPSLLAHRDQLDPLIRYLVARYGGLNVTWQGVERFENTPGSRSLLKDMGSFLQKYDSFQHPRSTDARDTSSTLLPDGWMNYLIEASPRPELGAVEHQFTEQPEVHVIASTKPTQFRQELWNATTNGQYPSLSYESLQNEANLKAVDTWVKIMSDTRHWELEPYFDVDGARAVGLTEVEYLAYAQNPGIVEITLPKHKYNPVWVNPATGEEIPLKDYRGEVFSRQTPNNAHDWILQVPREGHKESMLKYYYFESQDPPVQEIETDPAKAPFEIVDPPGDTINWSIPTPYSVRITRANRASRTMQYTWWGEVVASGEPPRVLAVGSHGNFSIPKDLVKERGANLHLKIQAINANGKAYEVDKVYSLTP